MKFFAAFFALYILLLSVLPCTDKGICAADQRVQHTAAAQKQDQHDHDTDEVCSPLCVCACCGQALSMASIPVAPAATVLLFNDEGPIAFYPAPLLSAYHINIWQPPRAC